MDYYLNKDINDLDGEYWIDAFGYDGLYSVSNYGRVKAEQREILNGRGSWIRKEFIMAQTKSGNGLIVKVGNGYRVGHIVFISFYPDKIPGKYECVMHKNKNGFDNRIENLTVETISKSHTVNHNHGLLPHLSKNNKSKHLKFESEYSVLKTKKCNQCGEEKAINLFEKKRYTCRKCRTDKNLERYYKSKSFGKT